MTHSKGWGKKKATSKEYIRKKMLPGHVCGILDTNGERP